VRIYSNYVKKFVNYSENLRLNIVSVLRIRIPHHIVKPALDPHQIKKLDSDPDPQQSQNQQNQDPDP
jgi:hypothetical protein